MNHYHSNNQVVFDNLLFGKINYNKEIIFFSYTDGLTETFNDKDEPFGVETVAWVIETNKEKSLEQINGALLKELNAFRGSNTYNDDITMLSCKVISNT